MNIVLYQPEIPHNTGAIGRTCLVTNSALHLIHPLGFFLDEKGLKRSGLDYWHSLRVYEYGSFEEFLDKNIVEQICLIETVGKKRYTDIRYNKGCFLVFGSETSGLPQKVLDEFAQDIVHIPMIQGERSLNLSVAVGIVLYEALRQTGYCDMS